MIFFLLAPAPLAGLRFPFSGLLVTVPPLRVTGFSGVSWQGDGNDPFVLDVGAGVTAWEVDTSDSGRKMSGVSDNRLSVSSILVFTTPMAL